MSNIEKQAELATNIKLSFRHWFPAKKSMFVFTSRY